MFVMFSTSNVRSCMLILSTETLAVVFQTPDPLVQNWCHIVLGVMFKGLLQAVNDFRSWAWEKIPKINKKETTQ